MSVYTDIVPIYGHLADFLNLLKYKMSVYTDNVDNVRIYGHLYKKKQTSLYNIHFYLWCIVCAQLYIKSFIQIINK